MQFNTIQFTIAYSFLFHVIALYIIMIKFQSIMFQQFQKYMLYKLMLF